MAVHIHIDGILDLHTFHPADLKSLIPEYLRECRNNNILQVRIIHGKGNGSLRRSTHAILQRQKYVTGFRLAGPEKGSWGATLVDLQPPE